MKRLRAITIYGGKAVKWNGDPCIDPKYGYNWFYHIPRIRIRGNPFKSKMVYIDATWLMVWASVIIYPLRTWGWWNEEARLNTALGIKKDK